MARSLTGVAPVFPPIYFIERIVELPIEPFREDVDDCSLLRPESTLSVGTFLKAVRLLDRLAIDTGLA